MMRVVRVIKVIRVIRVVPGAVEGRAWSAHCETTWDYQRVN